MAKLKTTNTVPVEERLTLLYELQKVDTQIDNIQKLKGELPSEVEALERELETLDTRLERAKIEAKELEAKMGKYKSQIGEAESLIEKYDKQQANIKNNREYESIMQQIELQKLEIQLLQKRIRETQTLITSKEQTLEGMVKKRESKNKELDAKREELKKIIAKTEKDEKNHLKQREKARKAIEERLLKQYDRIRAFYADGLAVVSVERDHHSCMGCNNQIPPQVVLELRQRKKLNTCEHCGRMLLDRGLAFGEETDLGEEGGSDYNEEPVEWD